MGIYIFNWKTLKDALVTNSEQPALDFGKHVIPYCHKKEAPLYAYEFNGYWKDVGTLSSYWEANMELIDIIPEFNLYEEFWKIYTKSDILPPQYVSKDAVIDKSIIGEGTSIYGEVKNSVIGAGVVIGEGAVVHDSVIMKGTVIGEHCKVDKAIIAENVKVDKNCAIGVGEELPNKMNEKVYAFGLATIGENSYIPSGVTIGKNTAISGETELADYPDKVLASGESIIKVGEK